MEKIEREGIYLFRQKIQNIKFLPDKQRNTNFRSTALCPEVVWKGKLIKRKKEWGGSGALLKEQEVKGERGKGNNN